MKICMVLLLFVSFLDAQTPVKETPARLAAAAPTEADTALLPRSMGGISEAFTSMSDKPYLMIENTKHTARVKRVAVTSDGKEIVTASYDKTMRVWNGETGEFLRTIRVPAYPGPEGRIYDMAVSADKKFIINAGWGVGSDFDKRNSRYIGDYFMVQNFATGELVGVCGAHSDVVQSVAISADGKRFVSGSTTLAYSRMRGASIEVVKTFNLFDVQKEFCSNCSVDEFNTTTMKFRSFEVLGLAFVPNSRDFLCVNQYGVLLRFRIDASDSVTYDLLGESVARKQSNLESEATYANVDLTALAIDPAGKYAVVGDAVGNVYVFDANGDNTVSGRGVSKEKLIRKTSTSSEGWVGGVSFNAAGTQVAVAIAHDVYVFEMPMLKRIAKFSLHDNSVQSVAFHPDGKRVISSGGDANQVYVWEAATGKLLYELGGAMDNPRITALRSHASNPNIIMLGSAKKARGFDLENLRVLPSVNPAEFQTVDASEPPDFKEDSYIGRFMCSAKFPNGDVLFGTENLLFYRTGGSSRIIGEVGMETRALAPGSDGRTFFAAKDDGRVLIFDRQSAMIIATLYIAANNEWILWTPEGYYAASRSGAKTVGWQMNNGLASTPKYYPFEQFDVRLNRPDLVLARLGGVRQKRVTMLATAYAKRLKRLGVKEEDLSQEMNVPTIAVTGAASVSPSNTITVKVRALDTLFALSRLNVSVNDVPLFGVMGRQIASKARAPYSADVPIELSDGRNKIQCSVMNARGVESFKETFYTTCTAAPAKGDLYVVAIGVSEYDDFNFNLTYAAKDAGDLVASLKGRTGRYRSIVPVLITNAGATREKILETKQLLMRSSVNDEVIVFFAGHGLLDDKLDYYLGTADVDFPNPSGRGLAYEELEGVLDGIPARKKLLLMDACHSGEVDKDESLLASDNSAPVSGVKSRGFKKVVSKNPSPVGLKNSFELMQEMFADLSKGSGAVVIASAGGKEFAYESGEWKNGVFTFSLLECMKQKTSPTVSEVREYVVDKVQALTMGKQTPTSRRENLENDFHVW